MNYILSKNFRLNELIKSKTAIKMGIDNTPTSVEIDNLKELCKNVLQPIRDVYNKPIVVDSGYRCKRVNELVGGSKTSGHLYGQAADIHSQSDTIKDNKELWDVIIKLIEEKAIVVDQLIDEYGLNWIHISYRKGNNRNEIKRATKQGNKTIYTPIK